MSSKLEQLEINEQADETVKTPQEEANGNEEKPDGNSTNNGDTHAPADAADNDSTQAQVDKPTNGHSNGTNGHTNGKVR